MRSQTPAPTVLKKEIYDFGIFRVFYVKTEPRIVVGWQVRSKKEWIDGIFIDDEVAPATPANMCKVLNEFGFISATLGYPDVLGGE